MKSESENNSQLRSTIRYQAVIIYDCKKVFLRKTRIECSTMPQNTTVDGIFCVKSIDTEGKKFANVSRVVCESESLQLNVCLDVNTQIFAVDEKCRLRLVLLLNASVNARKRWFL